MNPKKLLRPRKLLRDARIELKMRLKGRDGYAPGVWSVSTTEPGRPFWAQVNFYWFEHCGRPCWLPVYPEPRIMVGQSVTEGWPCEFYAPHNRRFGPHCYSPTRSAGDAVLVVGQIHGQWLQSERVMHDGTRESSDIWNLIVVPEERVTRPELLVRTPDGPHYYAYAADIWLSNTGWHGLATPIIGRR